MENEYSPGEKVIGDCCGKIGACFSTDEQPLLFTMMLSYADRCVVGTIKVPTAEQIAPWRVENETDDVRPLTLWAQEKVEEVVRVWTRKISPDLGHEVEPCHVTVNVSITIFSPFDTDAETLCRHL